MTDVDQLNYEILHLKRENERLQELLEGSGLPMGLYDPDGVLLLMNRSAAARLGGRPNDFIGKRITDFLPENGHEYLSRINKTLKTGQTVEYEDEVVLPIGRRQLLSTYFPVTDRQANQYAVQIITIDITAQHEAEAALEVQAAFLNKLFEASPEAIAILDSSYRIVRINPEFTNLFGYNANEAIGESIHELLVDEERRAEAVRLGTRASLGERVEFESIRLAKNGRPIEVSILGRQVSVGDHEEGVYVIYRDITKKKKTEALRLSNERRRKQAYQLARLGHWDWDVAFSQLIWSVEVYDIFGQDKDDFKLTVDSFESCIHPDDLVSLITERDKALAESRPKPIEYRIVRPNGEIRYVQEFLEVIKDENNRVVIVCGTVQDITDRKITEEDLIRSETLYRTLFETAGDAIFVAEPESGILLDVNAAAEQLMGYSREELIGRHQTVLHPPKDETGYRKAFNESATNQGRRFKEMEIINRSGNRVPVEISSGGTIEIGGQKIHVGFFRDISERYQAEAELNRMASLIENSNDFIGLSDLEGWVVYLNPAGCKMVGLEGLSAAKGKHITEFVAPDNVSVVTEQAIPGVMAEGIWKGENYLQNFQTGELVDVSVTVYAVGESRGAQPSYLAAIMRDIRNWRRAEEALRASEERLQLALDSVRDAVWDWRIDTGEVFFSPRWYTMLGYEPYELPQKFETWRQLLHPDDLLDSEKTVKQHLALGNSFKIEFRMRTKDGRWKWILARGKTVARDDQGGAVRMLGTHMDITERKKVEATLIESEQKWRNILINTPQIGVALNPHAEIIFANNHFLELTGWTEPEVIGLDWFDTFIPETVRGEVREVFTSVIESRDATGFSTYENKIITKQGELRNISWSNVLTKDSEGKIVDVTCLGIDLTERSKAEEKIRESEAKYRLLVENQTDLVVKVDLEGRFLFVSPSYCRMFGKNEAELLGRKLMPLVHGDDRLATAKAMEELFSPPYTTYIQQRALTKDGWKWLAWADSAVLDKNGMVFEIIGVGRDITALKESEQKKEDLESQLRQAQKMEAVGTLAGGIAHDFNNILTAISGYAELALEDSQSGISNSLLIDHILKAADRARALVTQILAFSRKLEPDLKPIHLNELIEQTGEMLKRTIPRMVSIEHNLADDLRLTTADPSQITQILINLGSNAADAMPDGGRLFIETANVALDEDYCKNHAGALPGDYVLLVFSDTGHGMDDETMEHIFEPFFTRKDIGKGTGLGLATVYGIVKNHNGYITCYSEVGRGTTIKVYLQALVQEHPQAEIVDSDDPEVLDGTETILLVDDEEEIRNLGGIGLKRHGYSVLLAENGEQALDIYRENSDQIDLIILDISMPGMGGLACLERLREMNSEAKVIIASGYALGGESTDATGRGASAFLDKPFSRPDLLSLIRKVLDQ